MDQFFLSLVGWLRTLQPWSVIWWVALFVVAILFIRLVIRRGWPAFRRFVNALSRGIKLVDTLANLPEDIAFIKHELDDNSGGSVKDAVKRTEKAVAELRGELADVRGDVVHVRGQAAALKTSLAKTNRRFDQISPPNDGLISMELRRVASPNEGSQS